MRVECPECETLVEAESFTCDKAPDRVTFYCPECDEEVVWQSEADDDEAEESGPALALVGELDPDGSVSEAVLGQLWELVTEDFSESSRHDAFIAACEAQNKLAFAASRYREWIEDHPDDEVAQKRQKQLLALAQVRALAVSSKQSKEKDPLKKALTAFLVMVVLLALVIVAAPILLRGARGCRATQPQPSQLRKPRGPQIMNLRRPAMGGYRGLTPRRFKGDTGQLRNLARPGAPRPMAPARPTAMRP